MIYIDETMLAKIEKLLYSYIWPGNIHKKNKQPFIAPIEFGGLGMVDIRACNLAAKGSWIKQ